MARNKNVDWIVLGGPNGATGHCQRCGDELHLPLPVLLSVWLAATKAFVAAHARCKDNNQRQLGFGVG